MNVNISKAQAEITSVPQSPNTDPLDLSEALWAPASRIWRTYAEKDINRLFLNRLIPSIKPNVRRYWEGHTLSDIYSLVNYVRYHMPHT